MVAGKLHHLHWKPACSLGDTYSDSERPYGNCDSSYHAAELQDGMQELAGVQRVPSLFLHPDLSTEVEETLKSFCSVKSANLG